MLGFMPSWVAARPKSATVGFSNVGMAVSAGSAPPLKPVVRLRESGYPDQGPARNRGRDLSNE
jgi:hypothetical protein